MRFIAIVVLKRMLPMLDDFFAVFIGFTNVIVAGMLSLVNCFSFRGLGQELKMMGMPTYIRQYSPISPDGVTAIIIVSSTVLILFSELKILLANQTEDIGQVAPLEEEGDPLPALNNVKYNQDLMNDGAVAALALMIFVLIMAGLVFLARSLTSNFYLISTSVAMLIVPALMYHRNQELRHYVFGLVSLI